MKKTLMYLIAIVATLATTFAMSSCSDDDDNNDGQYTLRIRVTQGSLNDVYYEAMKKTLERTETVSTDRAAAERAFDIAISSAEVELQTEVNDVATAAGVYDFSIVFELLDGKGKVVKTKVLVPTNNPG